VAVAYHALTDAEPHNCDYVLVGPELLSHDEVAALFSEILGRRIQHVKISEEQLAASFMKFGMPEAYARRLSDGESRASIGEFAILNGSVSRVTGRAPLDLRKYIEKHKHVW
jgi:festuclavine dehydrogenase